MAQGSAAVGMGETASSSIRRYFALAADRLGLHPEMRRLLSVPFRELTLELPLRRDDERLQLFRGYRVQHNGVRGPMLGPVRFQSGLELETLRAAAESMTWRCAVANVPFGGAAGGVACDPVRLSRREFERLTRRYTARVQHMLGMYQDICAPGINAGEEAMSWIAEEFSALENSALVPVLGRPSQTLGSRESEEIVGRATATLVARAAHDQGLPVSGLRVGLRSRDQSAFHSAFALAELGCLIVALSEERGGLHCSTGIDMQLLADHLRRTGSLGGFEGVAETNGVQALDCDALVLGGPEQTLNRAAGGRVRAKIVIETSEQVVTPDADHDLGKRDVWVVPDLVGAAGAVLTANAEWSSNLQGSFPPKQKVQQDTATALIRIYEQVYERSQRERISLRLAAYSLAVERVARSERLRVA